ncbi:MAG: type II secretion system protein GspM [Bryobacteraceae bacterium]|jgi:hypothetical protein
MTTGTIDRKTLLVLAGSVAAILILRFGVFADRAAPVVESVDSIPVAEQRLAHLREVAATLPARQRLLEGAQAELATREKTMLKADTMEQAQAQLLDLLQAVARANGIDSHGYERKDGRAIDADYGEVSVEVSFTCGIEQLVNLLAALGDQPQLVASEEIRVNHGNDKKKSVVVRLMVAAPVVGKLIPKKKGLAAF